MDPRRQAKNRPAKILAALERIGHIILTSTREAAGNAGLSPIQSRLLIHVATHEASESRLSVLARYFDLTVPTVSDAVNSLVRKGLLDKKKSADDARARVLRLTANGRNVYNDLATWSAPYERILGAMPATDLDALAESLLCFVSGLHVDGQVAVARMCPICTHFAREGDRSTARCLLLSEPLGPGDYRLDCPEWEPVGMAEE